ncbi:ectoine/hydroxyectoine ABC transporter substrate-binding protein EhuB [Mesorhizobium sp. PL10]
MVLAAAFAALTFTASVDPANSQSLLDKIKNGETIRVGFSNEPPAVYVGPNKEPLGYLNVIMLDILKRLGTTKVEPVVTEFGSLIPGLQAGRFDVISDGVYILPARCRNVLFTEPVVSFHEALVVPKGNPQGLHSYQDVRDKGLTFVAGAGWTEVKIAKEIGIAEDKIMQVAGTAEVVQAVKTGRAAAGGGDYLVLKRLVDRDDSLELASPFTEPVKPSQAAFSFPLDQQETVDAFNTVLKDYIGSDEMMNAVGKYEYTKMMLPDGTTTEEICNR